MINSSLVRTRDHFGAFKRRCYCTWFYIYHLDMSFWCDISQRKASLGWYAHDSCHNWWCCSYCSTSIHLWRPWIWREYPFWNHLLINICSLHRWIIHLPAQNQQWRSLYDSKFLLFNYWFLFYKSNYLDNNWVPSDLSGKLKEDGPKFELSMAELDGLRALISI